MRSIFKVVSIIMLVLVISFGAYPNGLNLNGMGPRAISMGGAFIAVADDYSAVFWNPAGITQMDKANFSIASTFIIPTGTYAYAPAMIDMETESKIFPAPAATYYKPISDKLVFGLTAYATAGAGAYWDGKPLVPFNTYFALGDTKAYKWESQVGAFTFSPVLGYKISDKFSIGATLNIVYGFLDMNKEAAGGQYTEEVSGVGFGATIGALIKPSDKFSIGLTFKTPQKLSLKGDITMEGLAMVPVPGFPTSAEITREITWPMWAGLGIAFKPTDKLTIAFDVQYTNWGKLDEIHAETEEAMWNMNLGTGSVIEGATYDLQWDDAIQYRVGFEYKLSDTFALRGGYYYDPAPAPATTLNILLPSITYNVFTLGVGYHSEKLVLDFGFEYFAGTDRDADMAGVMAGTAMPGTHGMSMIIPVASVTFIFN